MSIENRRRAGARRSVDLIPIFFTRQDEVYSGLVLNISGNGMRIVTQCSWLHRCISQNDEFLFTTWTPSGLFSMPGVVRWMIRGKHGYDLGIRLIDDLKNSYRLLTADEENGFQTEN